MTTQIKKLEWRHNTFNGGEEWLTTPIEGVLKYCILKQDEPYLIYRGMEIIHSADDLQSAKDFIQADFETKIKGCLS